MLSEPYAILPTTQVMKSFKMKYPGRAGEERKEVETKERRVPSREEEEKAAVCSRSEGGSNSMGRNHIYRNGDKLDNIPITSLSNTV